MSNSKGSHLAGGKKRVIVCPLDWGLGHATRCIPLIDEFLKQGSEILLAGDGSSIELLKQEFPGLSAIRLKGYNIRFSGKIPLPLMLLFQIPKIIFRIFKEHREIRRVIHNYNVDIIISDNRYGLWNKQAYSVFLTHQPNIIPPAGFGFISPLLRSITRWFIRKYDQCWIPDLPGEDNLSGKLSHGFPLPENTRFIGPLSRFYSYGSYSDAEEKELSDTIPQRPYKIVAIISGPEPQRTIFEEKVAQQLALVPERSLIIRGLPANGDIKNYVKTGKIIYQAGQTDARSHLPTKDLYTTINAIISKSGYGVKNNAIGVYITAGTLPVIICRGGYSTLMDLAITGNRMICIPTPGQTEQMYLAMKGYHEKKCVMADQDSFSIIRCLTELEKTNGYKISTGSIQFPVAIDDLCKAYSLRNTL
ncbi:MAG TPA: glycosyltransferase [Lentimicrobium sp.]|nr:glycosyltransferase [Lentimicrobium sp.]